MGAKFPREQAMEVAGEVVGRMDVLRVCIAGSLRRMKKEVGDIEIVYIPKIETGPDRRDLFAHCEQNLTDNSIQRMMDAGILCMRLNVKNTPAWGAKNKLAIHLESDIPVDLFATTPTAWDNYLVCRTGSAELNRKICMEAQVRGWKWHPYGSGFSNDKTGEEVLIKSEQEVFEFVGMKYLEPHERNL